MKALPITAGLIALVDRALSEDLSSGDATTDALIPESLEGRAAVVPKAEGVLAGIDVAMAVFRRVDPSLQARALMQDGTALKPHVAGSGRGGSLIAEIKGNVAPILKAERTAINFLQRLSGIATETRRYVGAVEGYGARILDTRKTTPGMRALERYAVRVGGGHNYRLGLGDGILIKDNHIQALRKGGMGLAEIVRKARAEAADTLRIEVEVEDVEQVKEALEGAPDILLLDNMGLRDMAEAVGLARGRALTEASGGITLDNVRSIAATGVDMISVGALTHSPRALDISLDLR